MRNCNGREKELLKKKTSKMPFQWGLCRKMNNTYGSTPLFLNGSSSKMKDTDQCPSFERKGHTFCCVDGARILFIIPLLIKVKLKKNETNYSLNIKKNPKTSKGF